MGNNKAGAEITTVMKLSVTAPSAHDLAASPEFTRSDPRDVLARVREQAIRAPMHQPCKSGIARRGTPDSKVAVPRKRKGWVDDRDSDPPLRSKKIPTVMV